MQLDLEGFKLNLLVLHHLDTFSRLLFIAVSNKVRFGLPIKIYVSSANKRGKQLTELPKSLIYCTVQQEK